MWIAYYANASAKGHYFSDNREGVTLHWVGFVGESPTWSNISSAVASCLATLSLMIYDPSWLAIKWLLFDEQHFVSESFVGIYLNNFKFIKRDGKKIHFKITMFLVRISYEVVKINKNINFFNIKHCTIH